MPYKQNISLLKLQRFEEKIIFFHSMAVLFKHVITITWRQYFTGVTKVNRLHCINHYETCFKIVDRSGSCFIITIKSPLIPIIIPCRNKVMQQSASSVWYNCLQLHTTSKNYPTRCLGIYSNGRWLQHGNTNWW